MLDLFDQRAAEDKAPIAVALRVKAAIGLMFFAGLRPGEARGVTWNDYDETKHLLTVNHSVWRSHITDPKTPESVKPVSVIEPLGSILAELRTADGNPTSGPILRGMNCGRPLDLEALARHVLVPALRDAKKPWRGWYACRNRNHTGNDHEGRECLEGAAASLQFGNDTPALRVGRAGSDAARNGAGGTAICADCCARREESCSKNAAS